MTETPFIESGIDRETPPAAPQVSAQTTGPKPAVDAQRSESWHWHRPDPLGNLYNRYPFKLLIRDHVGLDVGSKWIKYAVTRHGVGLPRILAAGGVPLVARSGGQMGKIRAQVAALLTVRDKVARGSQRWIVGMSGPGSIVRSVEVPQMPRGELREAVLWTAQKKIPFPLDEAHVAIQYLKTRANQPVRAVVSAAIKRMVDDLLYLLAEAEIRPSALTLPAFSLGKILEHSGHSQPGENYGLLDIGAEHTQFAIYRGDQMEFFREIDLGVGDVEEELALDVRIKQRYQQIDPEGAASILFNRGLAPSESDAPDEDDTSHSVNDALEKLLLEIQSTLEYYAAQSGGIRINQFMLMGGGAEIPGITRHLANFLETPVDILQPTTESISAQLEDHARMATPANWAAAYGYSLLPRKVSNLLPPDYLREQDAEFKSLLWRTGTGTAVAVSLLLAGTEFYRGEMATDRVANLNTQLAQTSAQLDLLGVPNTEATLTANRRWLETVSRLDLRTHKVLRTIADLTPQSVAIDRLDVQPKDSGYAHVSITGEVRTEHQQNEVVLADYIDRLSRTGWLYNVRLENHISKREPQFEQLLFQISLRAPLEERLP
jgi:type IV pilus assembly protein PilM